MKRHAMANHFAAKNLPIQKVNVLFGPIVTRRPGGDGRPAREDKPFGKKKKLRRINLLAMMGPHVMSAHPKKAAKKRGRPLHMIKRPFGSKANL